MKDRKYLHTTIDVDDRCLDLLLTQDEVAECHHRSLNVENSPYIDMDKCCKCWPVEKPDPLASSPSRSLEEASSILPLRWRC